MCSWYPWIHVFLCINLNFWQILKYTNFVWTDKKTSVTARNEKDPRSRLESPRKTYFEGLAINREAAILTICWHSSVEQVCHQLLTVTDRFIFATAYPHPLRYGSTHKPTLDFFVRSRGCLWGRWSLIGLGLLLLLSSLWPWCWVASLRMTQVTPVERWQEPNKKQRETTVDKLQMIRAPELGCSSTCSPLYGEQFQYGATHPSSIACFHSIHQFTVWHFSYNSKHLKGASRKRFRE